MNLFYSFAFTSINYYLTQTMYDYYLKKVMPLKLNSKKQLLAALPGILTDAGYPQYSVRLPQQLIQQYAFIPLGRAV